MIDLPPFGELRPAQYHKLARELGSQNDDSHDSLRVAFLGTNDFQFISPFFIVEAARAGVEVALWCGPFGQIEQQLLVDDGEGVWRHRPELVVIQIRPEDLYPGIFSAHKVADGEDISSCLNDCIERAVHCAEAIRKRSNANVLIANFSDSGHAAVQPIFDANNPSGIQFKISDANRLLCDKVQSLAGVDVWDFSGAVNAQGSASFVDMRMWFVARQPVSGPHLPYLAHHLARTVTALIRPAAKCLVLDLDYTLWGGVAGDDGIEGIQLGDDFPGNTYKAFQRVVTGLMQQGVLLAIASKNDESTVREIFDRHPEMVLKWSDFAAVRANWDSKSENLRSIAAELGIGVDSLAFFDDNPVERAEVASNAPESMVIDVPEDSALYASALINCGLFDMPRISVEDRMRGEMYAAEKKRRTHRNSSSTLKEFLGGLEMVAEITDVDESTLARAHQLESKTNQFNLTTQRHTEAFLKEACDSATTDVRIIRLRDRYGDSGLVGLTIATFAADTATVDTFIMSCRVMGRGVEQAMLADVVRRAQERDCKYLAGRFVATEKNVPAASFYEKHGFAWADSDGTAEIFTLQLSETPELIRWPQHIEWTNVHDS